MKNKLKSILIGKVFKEEDYSEELNNILKDFNLEANILDFDFDRLYNTGYEDKENWDDEYIGSLETEFITEEKEEHFIKIINVF